MTTARPAASPASSTTTPLALHRSTPFPTTRTSTAAREPARNSNRHPLARRRGRLGYRRSGRIAEMAELSTAPRVDRVSPTGMSRTAARPRGNEIQSFGVLPKSRRAGRDGRAVAFPPWSLAGAVEQRRRRSFRNLNGWSGDAFKG
ncbi:MAG: hypothetical protein AB7P02_05215 [Alphaproteobacteria bacterium]